MRSTSPATITIAFLTLAINYGSRGAFGLFLKPLAVEFEASRATISSILSINMLTFGAMAFLTGYLIDRFGTRMVLISGGSLAAASFILSGTAPDMLQVILVLGVIFGIATCFLSQITALSLVVKDSRGKISWLLGLIGSGPGIGSLFLTPVIGVIIASGGWRPAMFGIGALFLGYLLLLFLLFRQSGKSKTPSRQVEREDRSSTKMLFQESNLPPLFFSLFLMSIPIYGVLSQLAAYATDLGMSMTEASWALGLVSGSRVIFSPLMGWISDRVRSQKKLGAGILATAVLGILLISIAGSGKVLYLGAIVVGTAYASYTPIFASITRSLFGRDLFGRAWGLISIGGCIGSALGSWSGGYIHDLQGTYDLVWLIMALCFLLSSLALLLVDTTRSH